MSVGSWFDSHQGQETYLLSEPCLARRLVRPPVWIATEAVSLEVKQSARECDHLPHPVPWLMSGDMSSLPHTASWLAQGHLYQHSFI